MATSIPDVRSLKHLAWQGFRGGPVPSTFTRLRSCIVPAEITEAKKKICVFTLILKTVLKVKTDLHPNVQLKHCPLWC
jgi:hypothetical protein